MKKPSLILVIFFTLSVLFTPSSFAAAKTTNSTSTVVKFASKTIESAVRKAIKKPTGNVTKKDVLSITHLEVNHTSIGSIDGIQNLQNLTYLHLENGDIKDIGPLKSLKKLTDLDLWDNHIKDISPLSGLTNLRELVLNDNYFTDLTPLKGLKNLKWLCLVNSTVGNAITNIAPLSSLTGLESLSLAWNEVSDITPLSKLTKLRELFLHHNQIKNVSALTNLKLLTTLYLEDNPIVSYKPLKNIYRNLKEKDFTLDEPKTTPSPSPTPTPTPITEPDKVVLLPDKGLESTIRTLINKPHGDILRKDVFTITKIEYLGFGPIRSLEGIQDLENLEYIQLINHKISDLSPLKNLKKLKALCFDGNHITSITPLAGLINLEELYLDDNYFTDLSPLKDLIKLRCLYLVNMAVRNGISDITPLSNLTNLEILNLSYNSISNIEPLRKLAKLRKLYIHHDQINRLDALSNLKSLDALYLEDNPIVSYAPLKSIFNQLKDKDFTLDSPVFSSPVVVSNYTAPDLLIADIPDIYRFCAYGDAELQSYSNVSSFTMFLKEDLDTWGSVAADVGTGISKNSLDLSVYKYVILHMKGQKGGEEFMFGFGYGPTDYYYSRGLTTEWQDLVIDISSNTGNLKDTYQFGFEIGTQWTNNSVGTTIYVDGIKFTNQLPISPHILIK